MEDISSVVTDKSSLTGPSSITEEGLTETVSLFSQIALAILRLVTLLKG